MPATTILQSLVAAFEDSGNTDFSGSLGLWFGEVPQQLELPFLAFVSGGERPQFTTEQEYLDSGTVTFSIFAEGIAETERLALIVLAIYDPFIKNWNGLDFTGGIVSEWERVSYMPSLEPIQDVNARRVGRVDIQYAYTTQKSLPTP